MAYGWIVPLLVVGMVGLAYLCLDWHDHHPDSWKVELPDMLEYAFAHIIGVVAGTPTDNLRDYYGDHALWGARSIAIYEEGTRMYAVVTAYRDNGVEIIDITDPYDVTSVGNIYQKDGDYKLDGAQGIAVYENSTHRFAVVSSYHDDGIQVLDITDHSNIVGTDYLTTDDDGTLVMDGIWGLDVFGNSTHTFVITAAYVDRGVQIIDVTDPHNVTAVSGLRDSDGNYEMSGASNVLTFDESGRTYAAVAARLDDGIQMLDVTDPANINPVGKIDDFYGDGTLELSGARNMDIMEVDGRTYLVIASRDDDGVQILDVTDPANMKPAGRIDGGHAGDPTLVLDEPYGVAVFDLDGYRYAAVTGYLDHGVQIINVTDPDRPNPAGKILDTYWTALYKPWDVDTYEVDGTTYMVAAAYVDHGVQFYRLDPPLTNHPPVVDIGPDRTVNEGDTVTLEATATDPDGESLTIGWSCEPFARGSAGVSIDLGRFTTMSVTFTAPMVPDHGRPFIAEDRLAFTCTIQAADHHGTSHSDSMTLIVRAVPEDGPVIYLVGDRTPTISPGSTWRDPGATCTTVLDDTVSLPVTVTGSVDTGLEGAHRVTYSCEHAGRSDSATRVVTVFGGNTRPEIGIASIRTAIGPGDGSADFGSDANCIDGEDGSLQVTSSVTYHPGGETATIRYTCMDSRGSTASTTQKVVVVGGSSPPGIHLNEPGVYYLRVGDTWSDPGAYCIDPEDGRMPARVDRDGVDTTAPGRYTVSYQCVDSDGNSDGTLRNVIVEEASSNLPPHLVVSDRSDVIIPVNGTWSVPSATCTDREDGDITDLIWLYGVDDVDPTAPGVYRIYYFCTDSDNEETQAVVTIRVVE